MKVKGDQSNTVDGEIRELLIYISFPILPRVFPCMSYVNFFCRLLNSQGFRNFVSPFKRPEKVFQGLLQKKKKKS